MNIKMLDQVLSVSLPTAQAADDDIRKITWRLYNIHTYRDTNECLQHVFDILLPYATLLQKMQQDMGLEITNPMRVERGQFMTHGMGQDADMVDRVDAYLAQSATSYSDKEKQIVSYWCTQGGISADEAEKLINYAVYLYKNKPGFFSPQFKQKVTLEKRIADGEATVDEAMTQGDINVNIKLLVQHAPQEKIVEMLKHAKFKEYVAMPDNDEALQFIYDAAAAGKMETAEMLLKQMDFSHLDSKYASYQLSGIIHREYRNKNTRELDPDRKAVDLYLQLIDKLNSPLGSLHNAFYSLMETCGDDQHSEIIAQKIGHYLVDSGRLSELYNFEIDNLLHAVAYTDDRKLQKELGDKLSARDVANILSAMPRSERVGMFGKKDLPWETKDRRAAYNILEVLETKDNLKEIEGALCSVVAAEKVENTKFLLNFIRENKVPINYEKVYQVLGIDAPQVQIYMNAEKVHSESGVKDKEGIDGGIIKNAVDAAYALQKSGFKVPTNLSNPSARSAFPDRGKGKE